jgi:acetoin utilization deacetylase AcuC-like enzyme
MGEGHPECPQRLQAIEERLRGGGLLGRIQQVEAPAATVDQLLRVHDSAHIERVLQADTSSGLVWHDPDTAQGPDTAAAALHAAGAGVKAVELVLADQVELAFCAVRPPGHHAERSRAMGFCFFNNIAVAAAHALAQGLERVAILDFDVHYGNGTADIFAGDGRVRFYSTYQHPLYPYWEGLPGAGNLIDVALPPAAGSRQFRAAVGEHWLGALAEQRPQMILVSAGFDAHAEDPLAALRLGDDDYAWMAAQIRQVAESCCPGRVVAMLEGGYALQALGRSVECFLRPFLGASVMAA